MYVSARINKQAIVSFNKHKIDLLNYSEYTLSLFQLPFPIINFPPKSS